MNNQSESFNVYRRFGVRYMYYIFILFIGEEQLCQKIQLLNHFTLALCPVTLGKWVNVRIGELNLGCKLEPTAIIITSELERGLSILRFS